MLEGAAALMAVGAPEARQRPEPNRVLKASTLNGNVNVALGLVKHRVADVAIRSDLLAALAKMLAIVTPETADIVKVTNVVRVCSPVDLHLGNM
jgi:hypothetical protein